jgi:aminopeptidase N
VQAQNIKSESDTIDILNYSINLDLIYLSNQEIKGNAELKITPKHNNINRLKLDLLKLNIDSVKIENQINNNYTYNDTLLFINLTNSISTPDTISAKIFYHGNPVKDQSGWGGFYFSSDSSYAFNLGVGMQANPHNYGRVWYPCIDDFIDKATYDFAIKVKNTNTAVCNGLLDSVVNKQNYRVFHWSLKKEIPTYLTSVAVGNYTEFSDTYNSINSISIPISIYAKPGDSAAVATSFVNLKDMLASYENAFGPYQWPRVGYVGVPFSSGAMEHATNIALGFAYMNSGLAYEDLIAHELSHSWFGNLVTCSSAGDMWINEGWAVYSESIFREYKYGKQNYRNNIRDLKNHVIRNAHKNDGAYLALANVPHDNTYGTTVYDKGGTVAHTLRGYLGDSVFFDAMKAYMSNFAFKSVSNYEFRDFLTNQTGVDMTDFFEAWVFNEGFVNFSLDSFRIAVDVIPESTVEVSLKQKLHHKPNLANSNRIPIKFISDNWQHHDEIFTFSGQAASNTFMIAFEPTDVLIDPYGKIADASIGFLDTIRNVGTKYYTMAAFDLITNSIADSALVQIKHNWAAPDTMGANLPGLNISQSRFWTVNGIFPNGFKADGKFYYSRTMYDSDLLTNQFDSIIMLYRADAAMNWKPVSFTQTGIWAAGNLIVPNLKKGQYTLAVWEEDYVGIADKSSQNSDFIISPNPSNGIFEISNSQNIDFNKIEVYDISAKLIFSEKTNATSSLKLNLSSFESGIYLIKIYNNSFLISQKKIILHHD